MAYTKTVWQNNSYPSLNETNLNKIEDGIFEAHRIAETYASETEPGRVRFASQQEALAGTSGARAVSPLRLSQVLESVLGAYISSGSIVSVEANAFNFRPPAGTNGRIFIATDLGTIYLDNGVSWNLISTRSWSEITGKPSSFNPSNHASQHASGGADPITPASIGAANLNHASRHASGGADPITPASIGAANLNHASRHASDGADPITPASIGAANLNHASQHASGGTDPITPASIGAAPADLAVVGMVVPYGGSSDPAGGKWLICNGRALSRSQYDQLFSVLGTTYGAGDGSTTFNIPDLRGRVVMGAGEGPGLTNRSRGQRIGEEEHTLTNQEMPTHTHSASTVSAGAHTHSASTDSAGNHDHGGSTGQSGSHNHVTYARFADNTTATGGARRLYGLAGPGAAGDSGVLSGSTNYDGAHTHNIPDGGSHTHGVNIDSAGSHSHAVTVGNAGGGQAHNNIQPSLVMNYIIRVQT